MESLEFIPAKTEINYKRLTDASEIIFPRDFKENAIFHYTSIGGLDSILSRKTLWFTNIKYMNDKDEIVAGSNSFIKELTALGVQPKLPGLEDLSDEKQVFVCCFSLNGDSLPMWNYYTKDINSQGYNIEFDSKQLIESILKKNELLDGCDFSFGIVDYSENDDSKYSNFVINDIRSSADFFHAQILQFFVECMQKKKPTAVGEDTLNQLNEKIEKAKREGKPHNFPVYSFCGEECKFVQSIFSDYFPFIKRDCFKQEQEFRIVITVPNELLPKLKGNNQNGIYKFRISNGIMVPYLELNFSPDVIKSLTVSPTIRSDLVERSMQDFWSYCGFDKVNLHVKHSNLPVRF